VKGVCDIDELHFKGGEKGGEKREGEKKKETGIRKLKLMPSTSKSSGVGGGYGGEEC